MSELKRIAIENALRQVADPYLKRDWVMLQGIRNIQIEESSVTVDIELGYPCLGIRAELEEQVRKAVLATDQALIECNVNISWAVPPHQHNRAPDNLAGIKHIIPVASGKGGVGKSTSAVNIALALIAEGAKVGILDADIYGPSQHIMLGLGENSRPEVADGQFFKPIEAYGVKMISMGNLVTENTPMVWRGPMASGALQQLIKQTLWGELDYLIIDMPPGTGDIQLTISQSVPTSGAVVITTPQDIALLDAKKGIEMFRKVDVPVLGVVENMALHVCSQCGHQEHIFGSGGGQRIATEYHTTLLGSLPLDVAIREDVDAGRPTVVAQPNSPTALCYRNIARHLAARVWEQTRANLTPVPEIVISND